MNRGRNVENEAKLSPESMEELRRRALELKEEILHKQELEKAAQKGVILREENVKKTMLNIVEAGFREVAKRLHPDKGGTHLSMLVLNEAKERLKKSAR